MWESVRKKLSTQTRTLDNSGPDFGGADGAAVAAGELPHVARPGLLLAVAARAERTDPSQELCAGPESLKPVVVAANGAAAALNDPRLPLGRADRPAKPLGEGPQVGRPVPFLAVLVAAELVDAL